MKKTALLILVMLLPILLICQRPFAPIGAKWGEIIHCTPTFWPCPPDYPLHLTYEVTEDTIIQGKYCTLIPENDWFFGGNKTIIHQDTHLIYRYDTQAEEFKLALDFSKEVGESWEIEVPEHWGGTGTLTITVLEKEDVYRSVSIEGGFVSYSEIPLIEGFGGTIYNKRLLLGEEFFIISDPIIYSELTCYIDPDEGLLYGSAEQCEMIDTGVDEPEKRAFIVYPNPASTHIVLEGHYSLSETAQWSLSDALGRVVKREVLISNTTGQTMRIEDLANGIYFWKVHTAGKVIGTGKLMVMK